MEDIIYTYQQHAAAAASEGNRYKKLADQYSLLRLVVFLMMAVSVYIGIVADDFSIIAISFVALLLCFAWLVQRQSKYEQSRKYYVDLERVYNNELGSISSGTNIYSNGAQF